MKPEIQKLRLEYRQLQRQFSQLGWLSHGYVQDRGTGAGGPCYQWSRKESKKTVSVALSKEQYAAMKEASENWRQAQLILTGQAWCGCPRSHSGLHSRES